MHQKLKNVVNTILHGDVLDRLKELPDGIVQTVITSPPYWGLRDYGTAEWEGGDLGCDHLKKGKRTWGKQSTGSSTLSGKPSNDNHEQESFIGCYCKKCGARRIDNQLGLESTPEEYVAKMVEIFAEVRRVLRDDGTLWLNLGDSYASGKGDCYNPGGGNSSLGKNRKETGAHPLSRGNKSELEVSGLKPKDLCGIPWRIAFAFQGFAVVPYQSFHTWANQLKMAREAQDWEAVKIVEDHLRFYGMIYELLGSTFYLRSDIIWSKLNPMPESVTDRPSRSHEYIFLLSKSGTSQYWTHRDKNGTRDRPEPDYRWINDDTKEETNIKPDGWTTKNKMAWNRFNLWRGHDYYYDADAIREPHQEPERSGKPENMWSPNVEKDSQLISGGFGRGKYTHRIYNPSGRNRRTVWEIATQPYPEAHFATFPEKLVEPCILAGSNDRACGICGAAWERVTDYKANYGRREPSHVPNNEPSKVDSSEWKEPERKTLGFRPTCEHDNGDSRSIILDPFGGAGTTPFVALKNGRDHITIELKLEYVQMTVKRLKPLGNRPLPQQERLL